MSFSRSLLCSRQKKKLYKSNLWWRCITPYSFCKLLWFYRCLRWNVLQGFLSGEPHWFQAPSLLYGDTLLQTLACQLPMPPEWLWSFLMFRTLYHPSNSANQVHFVKTKSHANNYFYTLPNKALNFFLISCLWEFVRVLSIFMRADSSVPII